MFSVMMSVFLRQLILILTLKVRSVACCRAGWNQQPLVLQERGLRSALTLRWVLQLPAAGGEFLLCCLFCGFSALPCSVLCYSCVTCAARQCTSADVCLGFLEVLLRLIKARASEGVLFWRCSHIIVSPDVCVDFGCIRVADSSTCLWWILLHGPHTSVSEFLSGFGSASHTRSHSAGGLHQLSSDVFTK